MRKAAIDAYADLELPSAEEWKTEIRYVLNRDQNGLFLPFCCAVAYYIQNYILCFSDDGTRSGIR